MRIRDLVSTLDTHTITTVNDSKRDTLSYPIFDGYLMEIETEEPQLLDITVISYQLENNYLTITV